MFRWFCMVFVEEAKDMNEFECSLIIHKVRELCEFTTGTVRVLYGNCRNMEQRQDREEIEVSTYHYATTLSKGEQKPNKDRRSKIRSKYPHTLCTPPLQCWLRRPPKTTTHNPELTPLQYYRQVRVQLDNSPGQGWQPGQPPRASKRLHTVWGSTLTTILIHCRE